MIRSLVTQMLEAMEEAQKYAHNVGKYLHGVPQAITAAREYLATEPSGERAELISDLRRIADEGMADYANTGYPNSNAIKKAADMLEADAQQAKRVPMTDREISEIVNRYYRLMGPAEFARAIEAHHGITPAEKPTVDEPEDLYALALKADNWGQP